MPRAIQAVRAAAFVLALSTAAGAQNPDSPLDLPAEKETKGVEMIPMYGFQLLGGQNFYTGQTASLSGDANAVVAPALKLNDQWALLPSLSSNYTGTRQVVDLVAGGSLFTSQWDNALSVKGIYTPAESRWRLKPHVDVKYEFLREAAGEKLGQGLYDYGQTDVGFDAEFVYREPFAVRFGVDYFETHFPNYTSLESQAATQFQGQSLARELVGSYVLDTHSVLATFEADAPIKFGGLILEGRMSVLGERFPDQHVVDGSGSLIGPVREDAIVSVGATVKKIWDIDTDRKALASFNLTYNCDDSNQSSYDASQTRYLPLFYNYQEWKFSPEFKIFIGPAKHPMVVGASAAWWHRSYPNRPIQDATGNYLSASLYTDSWMAQTTFSYPIADHFDLLANVQYGQETSNQQFLELYQYDYKTATYMFGFSYDY
jgi:hypothetical protein